MSDTSISSNCLINKCTESRTLPPHTALISEPDHKKVFLEEKLCYCYNKHSSITIYHRNAQNVNSFEHTTSFTEVLIFVANGVHFCCH